MNKKIFIVAIILVGGIIFFVGNRLKSQQADLDATIQQNLLVYTYDSFVSEWGLGPKIEKAFTEQSGYTIKFYEFGDAISTLNALSNTDKNSEIYPDVMIGLDNNMIPTAEARSLFRDAHISPEIRAQLADFLFAKDSLTYIPFDYGYISLVYDSNAIDSPPTSLESLTSPEYRNKLILIDPRNSSPGLAFLYWTISAYGSEFTSYWERLKPSILTVTDGWSSAYGLFTSGEAPLVLSYTTSPAYHIEYEDAENIKSTAFENGNYIQVEYAAITAHTKQPEAAQSFIDFILSEHFQKEVALTNIMYPSIETTPLPESFSTLPIPPEAISLPTKDIADHRERWMREWEHSMSKK